MYFLYKTILKYIERAIRLSKMRPHKHFAHIWACIRPIFSCSEFVRKGSEY